MKSPQHPDRSETAVPTAILPEALWLVAINHHEARIFRSAAHGTLPEHVLPHDPEDFFRHAHNSKDFARGREKPDPNSFFAPIANAIMHAGRLLIFGSGTGMASEMDQFVAWLRVHQPELARRIDGALRIDQHHVTDDQLLARARDFYRPALPVAQPTS